MQLTNHASPAGPSAAGPWAAGPWAVVRRAALLGAALAMVVAAAGPGIAFGEEPEPAEPGPDTLTPIERPTVTITVDTDAADMASSSTTIVPASPRSEQVTEVVATVQLGGLPLDEVRLCLYLQGDDALDGCAIAEPDPSTHLVMTWRPDDVVEDEGVETDAGFRIVGSNQHADADAASDYLTARDEATNAYTLELTFRFRTSVALRAADEGWAVRVVAVDEQSNDSAITATLADWEQDGLTVEPFFAVTTARTPMAFGALIPLQSSVVEGARSGVFLSNARAKLSISATDFTATGSVLALRESGEPGTAEIALACNDGSTLDGPTRVTATAQDFVTGLYANGTGEVAVERTYSCEMTYGGGATGVGLEHSGTISIDIAADPVTDPASEPG